MNFLRAIPFLFLTLSVQAQSEGDVYLTSMVCFSLETMIVVAGAPAGEALKHKDCIITLPRWIIVVLGPSRGEYFDGEHWWRVHEAIGVKGSRGAYVIVPLDGT